MRITLALHGNEGVWHLFSVYGPTLQATEADKTRFWRELGRSWNHIPSRDIAYILGDFNCRVGSRQQPGYPHEVLGLHGVGPRNGNGDLMLQFCVSQSLCILNSFFAHDISHQATWRHKRWHTWGLLDMAVSRLTNRRFVMDVHAVPEAEVQSDHALVIMKLRACPDTQPAVATQQPDRSFHGFSRPRRLCVQRLREPAVATAVADDIFQRAASTGFTFLSLPQHFRDAGEQHLGTVSSGRPDWRQGHERALQHLVSVRQAAFEAWRHSPCDDTLQALRAARHNSRAQVRLLKQQWWASRLDLMQRAAHGKDPCNLYGESRQLGRLLKTHGLASKPLITNPKDHADNLATHFSNILNIDFPVDDNALNEIEPVHTGLPASHWDQPTWDEFLTARKQLSSNKACDSIGVHAELLKSLPLEGTGLRILTAIHELICNFWHSRLRPIDLQHWHESTLYPIYKGKGAYDDLNNWRGVVLLDIFFQTDKQNSE